MITSEPTTFTLDNQGRFLCNTLQEALDSTAQSVGGRNRGFDVIIVGGGSFGSIVAEHLFSTDTTRSRRILVLEAGPYILPEHTQNMPFLGGEPNPRVPWVFHPALNYTGLYFAAGGRSLNWGDGHRNCWTRSGPVGRRPCGTPCARRRPTRGISPTQAARSG